VCQDTRRCLAHPCNASRISSLTTSDGSAGGSPERRAWVDLRPVAEVKHDTRGSGVGGDGQVDSARVGVATTRHWASCGRVAVVLERERLLGHRHDVPQMPEFDREPPSRCGPEAAAAAIGASVVDRWAEPRRISMTFGTCMTSSRGWRPSRRCAARPATRTPVRCEPDLANAVTVCCMPDTVPRRGRRAYTPAPETCSRGAR